MALGDIPVLGGTAKLGLTALNVLPGNPGTEIANNFLGTHYDPRDPTVGFGAANVIGTQFGNLTGANQQPAATPSPYSAPSAPNQPPAPSTPPADGRVLGASTTGGSNTNAADLAYLSDQESQLRKMLASAQTTLDNGLTQLSDTSNKEVNRQKQAQATADANYGTQREDATRAKLSAIDQVNTGARTLADSVRRLLGLASGANSSAYQLAAPAAIARDATIKRTGVNETYGKDFRNIDTAQQNADTQFAQYLQDLADQRKQKELALRQGVIQQEQGINGDLADVARQRAQIQGGGYDAVKAATAPYQAAINDRQSALDTLFSQFRTPYNLQAPTVTTPQLSDYTVGRTTLTPGQGNVADPNATSPYAQFLKKKFQSQ